MATDYKYPVKSKQAERVVIQQGLVDEVHFLDMLQLSEQAFPTYKVLYNQLLEFWQETNTTPDIESFKTWCHNPDALDQLRGLGHNKETQKKKHLFYINTLRHAMIGQGMLDMAGYLAANVGKKDPHPKLLQSAIARLTELVTFSSDQAMTSRRLIWEDAPHRWENFKLYNEKPELLRGILFGIKEFDAATGGLHALETEADLVTFFGKTGVYKSRLMMNLAYNQVRKYIPVMYITKEMAAQRIGLLFDARESLEPPEKAKNKTKLDYQLLQDAYLVGRFKERYKQLLVTMYKKRKYPFWLVDYPGPMTTIDIIRELEVYKTRFGEYPRVIYLDYANLIDPVGDWGGQEHQKLDRIFLELVGITRGYKIPLVTAVRESRKGSLLHERDEIGIEHVGLSQAIAYHVHVMIHLDQTKDDVKAGILRARSKKNRYGRPFDVKLKVLPEYNYIGDWESTDKRDSFAGLDS